MVDFVRSGFLTALPSHTQPITPTPTYRTMLYQVFNGLPVALRAALGLPLADQTARYPSPTTAWRQCSRSDIATNRCEPTCARAST